MSNKERNREYYYMQNEEQVFVGPNRISVCLDSFLDLFFFPLYIHPTPHGKTARSNESLEHWIAVVPRLDKAILSEAVVDVI